MNMSETDNFFDCIDKFQQFSKKPETFLEANERTCNELKEFLKKNYDFMKKEQITAVKSNALPELIIQNFDLEQIWQQIELQNDDLLTRSLTSVSKLVTDSKAHLVFTNLKTEAEKNQANQDSPEGEVEDKDEALEESESNNEDESQESDEEVVDEDATLPEINPLNIDKSNSKTFKSKRTEVEDEFFKLDEMEQFLNAEEKKLNDPDSGNDSENSEAESDVSVDLFGDGSHDDEEVETARYKDFFVAKEEYKKPKRNKVLEELEESDGSEEGDEPKSSFELRQQRLSQKIEELEEDAIKEKPWQLSGEVTAEKRPQNSLLQEIVEFDLTTRPAPVITEQTSMQLEDIIKQRIKDKVFDSVERKMKPVETPLEYKKKLVLDQEKSKESLAQIYEKEYLQQKAALDPEHEEKEEIPELHKEIDKQMSDLFKKLDALSNFHFTPKPAAPELKIISNLPAINMEEVAPVAASDAALLAPEEVRNKPKADIIGKNERTGTDKKRERRKKKIKQKVHTKERERREILAKKAKPGLGIKYSKEKAKKILEKVTKEKNIDKMDESLGSKSVKSSKAFFTQLEEEVKSQIKSKSSTKRAKSRSSFNAKKMKL